MKIYDKERYDGDIKEDDDDITFTAERVIVAGDIDALNIDALNIVAGNIDARDIDALNIVALNIDARDIDARDIDAWNIVARNIVARNINAWNIDALNIVARNIDAGDCICSSRKGKGKTFCRFFAIRDHNAERKEWNIDAEIEKLKGETK